MALTSWLDRGGFRKFIGEHQQEKRRRGTACSGHTPSDDCDSVRIGSSGLRNEYPITPGTQ